jgi:hypothetical protein
VGLLVAVRSAALRADPSSSLGQAEEFANQPLELDPLANPKADRVRLLMYGWQGGFPGVRIQDLG